MTILLTEPGEIQDFARYLESIFADISADSIRSASAVEVTYNSNGSLKYWKVKQ